MATELERLVVSLEASITKYEKAMQRAVGASDKAATGIEKRWAKLNLGPKDIFSNVTKGAVAALAPLLTMQAALAETKAALKDFSDVADQSAAAGLDAEFFQGIAYQAKLAGVEIDSVAKATADFNKLSGQAVEGRGKLVTQLRAEHPELLKSIQLATTQEQRFRLVADAIQQAKDGSEAAAIATAAFGEAGARLAVVFRGGSAEIDKTMKKAQEMGLIIDRDLIARADELGDRFDTAAQIVDLQLKRAFVNAAPGLVGLVELSGQLLNNLNNGQDAYVRYAEQFNAMQRRRLQAGQGLGGGSIVLAPHGAGNESRGAARHDAGQLRDNTLLSSPTAEQVGAVTDGFKNLGDAVQYDSSAFDELQQQLETATQMGQEFASTFVNDLLDGKDVISSLGDALDGLGRQLIQMAANQAIQSLFGSLLGIAGSGGVTGGAWGNGLWGSAIFGGRAVGGPVGAGQPIKVGEGGPEIFVPNTSGRILPNNSGRGAVSVHFSINGTGLSADQIETRFRNFARFEMPALIGRAQRDPKAVG